MSEDDERLAYEIASMIDGEIRLCVRDLGGEPDALKGDPDHQHSLGVLAGAIIEAVRQKDLAKAHPDD